MPSIKSEYEEERPSRPFFYNEESFVNYKNSQFKIADILKTIRNSKEDAEKTKDMNDAQMIEMLYHDALIITWKNILSIEAMSGKRMNGLMLQFQSIHPELEISVMGAKERCVHSQKGESEIGNNLYSYATFIPLQEMLKYAIDEKSIDQEKLISELGSNSELSQFDILGSIMGVIRTIISENNPICATLCIDSMVVQQYSNRITGEKKQKDIRYSMNYTEFPNGKCVKSIYRLVPRSECSNLNKYVSSFAGIGIDFDNKIKSVPMPISDIIAMQEGYTKENLIKSAIANNTAKAAFQVFEDASFVSQIKKLHETGAIGLISDDVFDRETNKHEQLNGHSFYLYKNKDLDIYQRSQVNAQDEIMNFINDL